MLKFIRNSILFILFMNIMCLILSHVLTEVTTKDNRNICEEMDIPSPPVNLFFPMTNIYK